MEFKTKAALTERANDQTMPEIAAYYNGLPGVKPVKKSESREVAVKRIWAALSPEPEHANSNTRLNSEIYEHWCRRMREISSLYLDARFRVVDVERGFFRF